MKNRFQPNHSKTLWRLCYSQFHPTQPELPPDAIEQTALGREQSVAWLLKHFDDIVQHIDEITARLRHQKLSQQDRGCLERALTNLSKIKQMTLNDLAWYGIKPSPNQDSTGSTAAA